jgi:hypothetical protein
MVVVHRVVVVMMGLVWLILQASLSGLVMPAAALSSL